MRFMIIIKATKDSEAGVMPEESLVVEMAARQLFELDDFAPGEAIDRLRAIDLGTSH